MHRAQGFLIVSAAAGAILALASPLRRRLPTLLVVVALAVLGALLGFGGALIEAETGPSQAIAAAALLATLTPLHVHVVLGLRGRGASRTER